MSEWARVTLGEIATEKGLVGGPFGSSLVSADYVTHGIPVIRGTNLNEGKYVGGDFAFVSDEKYVNDLARNSASPGDIVFTQRGTLGQVAIVPEGDINTYVISQSQMRMRVNQEIVEPEFVFYFALGPDFQSQLHARAIATGVPHINLGILSSMTISLPPLPMQRKIIAVLQALDAKIALNWHMVRVARELAASIVRSSPNATKISLGEIVEHHRRQLNPWEQAASMVRHFSLPAFDQGEQAATEDPRSIKSAKFHIDAPSVLFSKLNAHIPRIWLARPTISVESYASTEFVVLKPRKISAELLWLLCIQPEVSGELAGLARGTSNSHQRVSPADILERQVLDPSGLPEKVIRRCDGIMRLSASLHEEIHNLVHLRDSLLPHLIDGTLAVRTAEDLVREVL